jgi:hypothetical protein
LQKPVAELAEEGEWMITDLAIRESENVAGGPQAGVLALSSRLRPESMFMAVTTWR